MNESPAQKELSSAAPIWHWRENNRAALSANAAAALLFAAICILYVAIPTKDYYWDGISFASIIEQSTSFRSALFNPNHLLYDVAGYGVYRAAHAVGWHARAVSVLILGNSLVGAIAALLVFSTALSISGSTYLSVVLTLIFAVSATWWKFSTDADAYIFSVTLLIASFRLLLPKAASRPALVGILHGMAMLFHELAFLFYPVAVLGIAMQERAGTTRRRSSILLYTVVAAAVVVPAYIAGFKYNNPVGGIAAFWRWITVHDPAVGFTANLGWNFEHSLRSNVQLVLATRVSLVRHEPLAQVVLIAACAVVLILCARLAVKPGELSRCLAKVKQADRCLVAVTALWIFAYMLFLFFWLPQTTYYRLFYLPAIIFLVAAVLTPYEAAKSRAERSGNAVLCVIGLALINFALLIYPLSKARNSPPIWFAEKIHSRWPPGTIVYADRFSSVIVNWYIQYLNPQSEWHPLPRGIVPISEEQLQDVYAKGQTVWLDTTAVDLPQWNDPPLRDWLRQHTRPEANVQSDAPGWNIRFVQIFPVRAVRQDTPRACNRCCSGSVG